MINCKSSRTACKQAAPHLNGDKTMLCTQARKCMCIKDIVGTAACRIKVDSQSKSLGDWRSTGLTLDTDQHAALDDRWRRDLCLGADHVLKESWVTANDPHYVRDLVIRLLLALRARCPHENLLCVLCMCACCLDGLRTLSCGHTFTRTAAAVYTASVAVVACTASFKIDCCWYRVDSAATASMPFGS